MKPSNNSDEVRLWPFPVPTAHYCEVGIVAEGLTLIFERVAAGDISCTDRKPVHPKGPRRTSRDNFLKAYSIAKKAMDELLKIERGREKMAESAILVNESTTTECSLSYFGWCVSYTCEWNLPLTWENLRKVAAMDERVRPQDELPPLPDLTDKEWNALKKRAFSSIQRNRRTHGYRDDGRGLLSTNQLVLEFA